MPNLELKNIVLERVRKGFCRIFSSMIELKFYVPFYGDGTQWDRL